MGAIGATAAVPQRALMGVREDMLDHPRHTNPLPQQPSLPYWVRQALQSQTAMAYANWIKQLIRDDLHPCA